MRVMERDSGDDGGTGGGRTEPIGTSARSAHALPEIRTGRALSAERVRVADDYAAALEDFGHPNTCIAAALDVSESVVRRLRSAEKPLSLAHLSLGPEEVFVRVLARAAVRAFGGAGALRFFAACMTAATKEETR